MVIRQLITHKPKITSVLILLTFSLVNGFCYAQELINNNFRHISTSDGYSLNSVNSIDQDEMGMIWFGTRNGLMRYDGKELKVMRRVKGDIEQLRANDIFSIYFDSLKGIWIGSKDGLGLYNPLMDTTKNFDWKESTLESTSSNLINDILRVDQYEVWMATKNGINAYNESEKVMSYYLHDADDPNTLNNNFITSLLKTSSGTIWVGTQFGLNKLITREKGNIKFKRFSFENSSPATSSHRWVSSIKEDAKGNLWVGTHRGLFYFDVITEKFEQFGVKDDQQLTNELVQDITLDEHQRIWVATYDGLNVLDSSHKLLHKFKHDPKKTNGLAGNNIRALFTDKEGGIWISTYFGGVNYWDDNELNFEKIEERSGTQLGYNVVSSMIETEDGQVYFGTEGAGLNIMENESGRFKKINQLSRGNFIGSVKALVYEGNDKLWIGTFTRGLIYLDLNSREFKEYRMKPTNREKYNSGMSSDQIISLSRSRDGRIWIGTLNRGLDLFDPKTNEFINFNTNPETPFIPNNNVRAILQSRDGDMFVGTGEGLCVMKTGSYQKSEYKFQFFEMANGDENNLYIHDILEDKNGKIWLGAQNFGLFYVDGSKIYSANIPGVSSIFSMVEDHEGRLWMSTEEGILSYDPSTGKHKVFNHNDGVQANEFNRGAKLYTSKGRVFFGGASGVSTFVPQNLKKSNGYAPPVVITGLRVSDHTVSAQDSTGILRQSIEYTKEVTLDYDQNIFTIHFAMPNYVNSEKNTYQYRLRGLDDHWVSTTNSFVSYTIQRGGDYVFEVKGVNSDGKESAVVTPLKVKVKSAPWLTGWAYTLYGLLILAALIVFIYFFKSRIRLQHKLEMETQEFLNQQTLNQQKLQFFTNISHEFRTPLTLISGPLEKLISNYKGPSSVFRQLQVIKRNTDQLFKLINELMDFRKLESKQMKLQAAEGNIVKFAHEIFLSFVQQAKINKLEYTFLPQQEEIAVYFDRDKLEKVLYNLISNAFKYTPKKGKIEVIISQSEGKVHINVKDSGIGMGPDHLEKIFDRFYEIPHQKSQAKVSYGSGIGLAIAKNVMDLHKGELRVESEEGRGSDFVMTLRMGREHLTEEEIIPSFRGSEDISQYKASEALMEIGDHDLSSEEADREAEKNGSILIVEDNPEIGQFIQSILADEYKVTLVENGAIGCQKALSIQPDLIISDVMMPVMDGIEFCAKIKSDIRTSHIPFILLTARTSLVYKYNGLESGADEYLSKPFEVKELLLKCRNIMTTHKKLKEKIADTGEFAPSEVNVNSRDEEMMKNAIQTIKDNIDNEFFDIQFLCEELAISRSLLFTKFKAWTNQTPNDFILLTRMKKAANLFEQGNNNISEVGYQVGFKNPNYFSKTFKKHYGLSPKAYIKRFKDNLGVE